MRYHTYTASRRYTLVIGQIGGFALPSPLTIPQGITLIASAIGVIMTRATWYPYTGSYGIGVAMALPFLLTHAMAWVPTQGRTIPRRLLGQWRVWFAPPVFVRAGQDALGLPQAVCEPSQMFPSPVAVLLGHVPSFTSKDSHVPSSFT